MMYFTLQEFLRSDTAVQRGIQNTPTFTIVEHLKSLAQVLDIVRAGWGAPIRVTSGYRCPDLNKAVGGSTTSAHLLGWAADLQPANGTQREFNEFVAAFLKSKGIGFDQLIRERSGKTEWLHFGLFNAQGQQRRQIKDIIL